MSHLSTVGYVRKENPSTRLRILGLVNLVKEIGCFLLSGFRNKMEIWIERCRLLFLLARLF